MRFNEPTTRTARRSCGKKLQPRPDTGPAAALAVRWFIVACFRAGSQPVGSACRAELVAPDSAQQAGSAACHPPPIEQQCPGLGHRNKENVRFRHSLTCLASLLCFTASTSAGDWPQWRYDAGRGAATPEELPAELHLKWMRQLATPRPAWPESQPWLRTIGSSYRRWSTIASPLTTPGQAMSSGGSSATARCGWRRSLTKGRSTSPPTTAISIV